MKSVFILIRPERHGKECEIVEMDLTSVSSITHCYSDVNKEWYEGIYPSSRAKGKVKFESLLINTWTRDFFCVRVGSEIVRNFVLKSCFCLTHIF